MNITDTQAEACKAVTKQLQQAGFRAISDLRNEKIGFKIRERTLERIPFMLVLGDKEVASDQVNVRTREGKNLGVMPLADFITHLEDAISQKGRYLINKDEE